MAIRLTDEEFDLALKPEAKPTPKAPGYWQCVFWFDPQSSWLGVVSLGNDEWLAHRTRWPSEEIADAKGEKDAAAARAQFGWDVCRYVRAEYFPDYPGGAS